MNKRVESFFKKIKEFVFGVDTEIEIDKIWYKRKYSPWHTKVKIIAYTNGWIKFILLTIDGNDLKNSKEYSMSEGEFRHYYRRLDQ